MSWIEQEMGEIVQLNEKIRSAFSAIGADQMDWKPDSKTWSINECFDHILQNNRTYQALLRRRPMRSFGRTKTGRCVFYRRPV